jgi:hypothetical protein
MSQQSQNNRRPAPGGVTKFTTIALFSALALALVIVVGLAIALATDGGPDPKPQPGQATTAEPQQT